MAERRFGPGFAAHAAPEAMRAHLVELRRKRATLDRDIQRLEQMLVTRCREVQRGEWPPCLTEGAAVEVEDDASSTLPRTVPPTYRRRLT